MIFNILHPALRVSPGGRGEKAGLREGFEVLSVDGQTLKELVHKDAASFIYTIWVEQRKLKLVVRVHSNAYQIHIRILE